MTFRTWNVVHSMCDLKLKIKNHYFTFDPSQARPRGLSCCWVTCESANSTQDIDPILGFDKFLITQINKILILIQNIIFLTFPPLSVSVPSTDPLPLFLSSPSLTVGLTGLTGAATATGRRAAASSCPTKTRQKIRTRPYTHTHTQRRERERRWLTQEGAVVGLLRGWEKRAWEKVA